MNVIQDNAELLAENVRLLQRDLEAEARAGPDPAEEAVPLQEAPKEGGASHSRSPSVAALWCWFTVVAVCETHYLPS
jgi:hypothetical protein